MKKTMSEDRAREFWDRHAKRYDRSMIVLGQPMERAVELSAGAVHGAARVLEVAAGTGLFTLSLARAAASVVATDFAPEMVQALRTRVEAAGVTNIECREADLYSLPFEPGSFDAVVAANVLHLVPDFQGAIAGLRRALRPGGRLVSPTFCHDETRLSWVVSRLGGVVGFPARRRFTARSLREALEREGLQITRTETIPGLVPIGYVEGRFAAPSD